MAKWHRREQKRWRKRRERQRYNKQTHMITVTRDGRTAVGPTTDQAVTRRYIAAHSFVPKGIKAWSDDQMRKIAATVVPDEPASWERALILLAHHESQLGCDLIKALWDEAPEVLHGFCEQAYAEALMWIGESYDAADEAGEVIFDGQASGGGRSN